MRCSPKLLYAIKYIQTAYGGGTERLKLRIRSAFKIYFHSQLCITY